MNAITSCHCCSTSSHTTPGRLHCTQHSKHEHQALCNSVLLSRRWHKQHSILTQQPCNKLSSSSLWLVVMLWNPITSEQPTLVLQIHTQSFSVATEKFHTDHDYGCSKDKRYNRYFYTVQFILSCFEKNIFYTPSENIVIYWSSQSQHSGIMVTVLDSGSTPGCFLIM